MSRELRKVVLEVGLRHCRHIRHPRLAQICQQSVLLDRLCIQQHLERKSPARQSAAPSLSAYLQNHRFRLRMESSLTLRRRCLSIRASGLLLSGRRGTLCSYIPVNSRTDTFSGIVQIISIPPFPRRPRCSHSFDLKHSGNLRIGPGQVLSLAWSADGYCLAVGYENGWAAWSMGGRLGGWGIKSDEDDNEKQEAFMTGVSQLVRPYYLRPPALSDTETRLTWPVLGSRQHGAFCSIKYQGRATPTTVLYSVCEKCDYQPTLSCTCRHEYIRRGFV